MKRFVVVSLIGSGVGCSVEAPDYAAKGCPCVSGFRCDDATQTCEPEALIRIRDFRGDWATPNQLHWSWTPHGAAADFSSYELYVATSEAELLSRTYTRRYSSNESPELGRFTLPNTEIEEPLRGTTSDELDPDTLYYAQLVATDTQLRTHVSEVAALRTGLPPQRTVTLYDDSRQGGYLLPECATETGTLPFGGSGRSLEYVVQCTTRIETKEDGGTKEVREATCDSDGTTDCWLQMKLNDQVFDLSTLSVGEVQSAYLEFALAIESSVDVYWGGVTLSVPDGGYWLQPISYRADSAYRVYQVPLTAMTSRNGALTASALTRPAHQFFVEGSLPQGAIVRLDAIRVRW